MVFPKGAFFSKFSIQNSHNLTRPPKLTLLVVEVRASGSSVPPIYTILPEGEILERKKMEIKAPYNPTKATSSPGPRLCLNYLLRIQAPLLYVYKRRHNRVYHVFTNWKYFQT
jgi:hypothetical protein